MTQSVDTLPSAGGSYAWRKGYLLLAFTALTWGINFPILKMGLAYSPPLIYTTLRMILGTVTMFMIALLMGILRVPHRADILGFCLIGCGILVVGLAERHQARRMRRHLSGPTP